MTKHADKAPKKHRRYTLFYLIMLIFSSINAFFIALSFANIPTAIGHLQQTPALSGASLVSTVIAGPMAIAGLVFLYRKQHLGLYFMFASYALSFFVNATLLFFIDQTAAYLVSTYSPAEINLLGGTHAATAFLRTISYTVSLAVLCTAPVYGTLWYYAWRSQAKADHKRQ